LFLTDCSLFGYIRRLKIRLKFEACQLKEIDDE